MTWVFGVRSQFHCKRSAAPKGRAAGTGNLGSDPENARSRIPVPLPFPFPLGLRYRSLFLEALEWGGDKLLSLPLWLKMQYRYGTGVALQLPVDLAERAQRCLKSQTSDLKRQISILLPNSTTALFGKFKKSAAPLALWCICANSFSRHGAMPLPRVGMITSRDKK